MSKPFGGEHSPSSNPNNAFRGRPVRKISGAARALFFLPIPLLISGIGEVFQGDVIGMGLELGGFAFMMLSAWLLNEGLRAEEQFNARKIAKPPAIPRKIFAAAAIGIGVAAGAYAGFSVSAIGALAMGVLASACQLVAFGLDPLRGKGVEGIDEFQAERVATAVDRAEELVAQTLDAARRIGDHGLEARVERLAASARDLFRRVEDDPRDLPRARKFMSVYLKGARDATAKFADIYSRNRNQDARDKYEALLNDLEISFADQKEQLLLEDRTSLDIEIEVLQERLQKEGVIAR